MRLPKINTKKINPKLLKRRNIFLEKKIKLQNDLLDFIIDNSSICYSLVDISGKIVGINEKCLKLFGYDIDYIKKIYLKDIIKTIDGKGFNVEEYEESFYNVEIEIIKKNLETVKGYISGFATEDEEYSKKLFYVIFEPATYKHLAENELEYERYLLQVLMDNIPDTIYFKDKNSRFTRINKAQAKLLGVNKPEDAIGKTDFDYFKIQHAEKAYKDEESIKRTGEPIINKEEKLVFDDRPTIWVSTTKVGVSNPKKNQIDQIVGITRDITAKKEAEESLKEAYEKAKEADRLKSAFLANMSHEIRTPLNAILGFANLLNDNKLSEEKRQKFISIITSSGNLLLDLINDIIDIAKIEAGQLKITIKQLELISFLKEIFLQFEEQRKTENKTTFNLELIIPDTEKLMINTDPSRLRQIISNLLGNAFKFTKQGAISFGYTVDNMKNEIVFFVKDTGIGIPKDKVDLIFERFGQVIEEKDYADKGTGLGLAISKGLVHLLGGRIWVETECKEGSEFYFSIPADIIDDYDIPLNAKEIDIRSINWNGKTVLIIEDDLYSADFLKEALTSTKIFIEITNNADNAIKLLKKNKYDIILLDIKLKHSDGYKLFKQIRKIDKNVPIIAQTAYAMNEEEDKTKNMGFNGYLSKPIQIKELYKVLFKFI